jgi:hypothetical protein
MDPLLAKDIFTLSCAVIGAVLGVINTWHGLNQRRVKLKVVPKIAYPIIPAESGGGAGYVLEVTGPGVFPVRRGREMGCIEVTNLSAFPVTVREVGFTIDGDPRKKTRAVISRPILRDDGSWPRRLESRASVSLYFEWGRPKHNNKRAYVLTDCGTVGYGNSPALKSMRKRLSSA